MNEENDKIKHCDEEEEKGAVWDQLVNEPPSTEAFDEEPILTLSEIKSDVPDETPDHIIIPEEEGVIDPISLKLDEIEKQLRELKKDFNLKIKIDDQKNKIIDSLHNELQSYKDDILKKYLKPLIMDLIQFIDNIKRLNKYYNVENQSGCNSGKLLSLIESIPFDIEDICARQGVTPYNCEGDVFDPIRQMVSKRIETNDKTKDKTIAERLRPGYEWDGKVIRREIVAVYTYKEPYKEPEIKTE